MTITKIFGILAVFCLIVGFFCLASSFANPVPWPTPTPTAEPTATPTPTPKPEPTAKPALEMYCRSTSDKNDLKVDVTGILTYNKTAIRNAPVYIGFSADSGNNWEDFTLVQTGSDGAFAALWTPNATGSYLMCARWGGNDSLHWVNATVNLALTPDSEGNEFTVVSNSTISNLAYNSRTKELRFTTNGTLATTAYAYASIPKTLLGDIQEITVNMDGQPIEYESESHEDIWVISCVYSQSEHVFTIQLPSVELLDSQATPWAPIAIITIVILIAVIAVILIIKRKRRTAATVESILKENRPTY